MIYKKYIGLWDAEKHKDIAGKLLAIQTEIKIAGYDYNKVYVIETEEYVFRVCGASVLDSKMKNINATPGNYVKIIFLGMKKGEKSEYKEYDVYLGSENLRTIAE